MNNNIKFTTIILFLCSSFFLESASLSRYDFTERLANCSLFNQNQASTGNSIGTSTYGTIDNGSMANFVSCFDPNPLNPSSQINTLNMFPLSFSTGCRGIKIPVISGCGFELTSTNSGNTIAVANSISGFSGFGIYSCDNTGNWREEQVFCSTIADDSCPSQIHSWSNTNGTCQANVSELDSGESIRIANTVAEMNGYASVSCNNGVLIGGTSICNYGCDGLAGQEVSWIVSGQKCTGTLIAGNTPNIYTSVARNGDTQYIDYFGQETNFVYGTASFICKNGKPSPVSPTCQKLNITSPVSPLVNCPEVAVDFISSTGVSREQYRHKRCDWN